MFYKKDPEACARNFNNGILTEGEHCSFDLPIKVACFVKKENKIFSLEMS
jgi:hypothetical protein